jgi:hypothetical protein
MIYERIVAMFGRRVEPQRHNPTHEHRRLVSQFRNDRGLFGARPTLLDQRSGLERAVQ